MQMKVCIVILAFIDDENVRVLAKRPHSYTASVIFWNVIYKYIRLDIKPKTS